MSITHLIYSICNGILFLTMYKKILAAVNEHLNSEVSARYAIEFSRITDSKLYLCYIAEKDVSARAFKLAEATVKRLFLTAKDRGIKAESIFASGDPADKIREVVTTEGINIVFAATRRKDIERRF